MAYQYLYLIIDLVILPIWLILFMKEKGIRKEMLFVSLIAGIVGIFGEIIYTQDWWRPITVTGGAIGVETFFFGFLIGGISSVIYTVLSKEKLTQAKPIKKQIIKILGIPVIGTIVFFVGYYLFGINSFLLTLIIFGLSTLIILYHRKDLITNSIVSGSALSLIGIITYLVLSFLFPEWINAFLYFQNIPKMIILGIIPLEDFIWFFMTGCLLGPMYEYWTDQYKIKKTKRK